MDERNILIVVGLACDLVGAFLLSIPLVWDARAAGRFFMRRVWRLRMWGRKFFKRHEGKLYFLGAVVALYIMLTTIGPLRPLMEEFFGPLNDLPLLIRLMVEVAGLIISGTVLLLILSFLIGSIFAIFHQLGLFLIWIAKGRREKKIGIVGLLILCLGFALQAWVNFIT